MQTVKVHLSSTEPWMSQKVKALVKKRQVAFKSGKDKVYNKLPLLRNKLQREREREIKKTKVNFCANRVHIFSKQIQESGTSKLKQ